MGKKEDYYRKRQETAKNIKSYTDFHGRVYTACSECQNVHNCSHSTANGCMAGKIKDDLKGYL